MRLIGMLDSPYVRRVAVSLQLLGLRFEHQSLSVFSTFDRFRAINPVVKAPSLVCNDGVVLMDSGLILEYAEGLAGKRRSLLPTEAAARTRAYRTIGLAQAACEKSVQIVYERELRPADKQHGPWLARVEDQLRSAFGELEAQQRAQPLAAGRDTIDQAGVSTAVAWWFTQAMHPGLGLAAVHPALAAFSAEAEQLPEFRAAPHGEATYREGLAPAVLPM